MDPASRTAHGLAFDSVRQMVVLFAGLIQPGTGPQAPAGDTWEQNTDPATQTTGTGRSTTLTLTSFVASAATTTGSNLFMTNLTFELNLAAPPGGAIIDLHRSALGSVLGTPQVTVLAGQVSFSYSLETISFVGLALPPGTTLSATLQNSNTLSTPVA